MGIDNLKLGELKSAMDLYSSLSEATMKHALVILSEPDHKCGIDDMDDDFAEMPDFDDFDVKAYLSYEESCLGIFAMIRRALVAQGFDTIREEIGT